MSGYPAYLAGVELDHANDILSDLHGVIVDALRPGFQLSRIEGDAAFMFSIVAEIDGSMLLDTIENCCFEFRRRGHTHRGPEPAIEPGTVAPDG